ncbi:MAG: VRR-NUC domain-containing protein [Christensenellales bacterium]|jgi:hypothetical protein
MTGEELEQKYLMDWAKLQTCKYPELKSLYHIPNGGHRHKVTAIRLKMTGVKAGVPDLCLPVARGPYHGLYIEMKYGKNKPSPAQKEWLRRLTEQGYKTAVCWGWEEAKDAILGYLKQKPVDMANGIEYIKE